MGDSTVTVRPLSREQILWIFGALVAAGLLVWMLRPVLTPFFIGFLIAYMANPVVSRLERWNLRRDLAVALVFAVVVLAVGVGLLIGIPVLVREAADLVNRVPEWLELFQQRTLPWIEERLGIELNIEAIDYARARELAQEYYQSILGTAGKALAAVTDSGGRFLIWITGMLLLPLVTFYLMRDWNRLLDALREMLPRNVEPTATRLARECDEALGGFLRGQLMVMLSLGAIYSVGLLIVGLNNAIAIGMIAGLVSFVPYLGAIIGILLAGTTAFLQNPDLWFLFAVALVFIIGQLIESFVLTPNLVGDRIGLHPVLVIFAVMAGGHLFGFTGVLLALPAAAAGTVLVRHAYRSYRESAIYGGDSP